MLHQTFSFNYFEQWINIAFDISVCLNVMQMEILILLVEVITLCFHDVWNLAFEFVLTLCRSIVWLPYSFIFAEIMPLCIWWHCFINTFKIFVYSWPSYWCKFAYYTSASGSVPNLGLLVLLWAWQHVIKISLDLFCVERWLLIFFFSKCWIAKKHTSNCLFNRALCVLNTFTSVLKIFW